MYTVLPSPLLQRISGLRFQPLVDLHSGQMFAHEVLVEIHNVNLEILFASLPSRSALQIFFWQANTLLQIPARDAYWLNLPAEHLLDERAIRLLLALRHQQRLTIEIQDPHTITRLSKAEQHRLHATLVRLKEAGWQIWLDDLTRELAEALCRRSGQVSRNQFLSKASRIRGIWRAPARLAHSLARVFCGPKAAPMPA